MPQVKRMVGGSARREMRGVRGNEVPGCLSALGGCGHVRSVLPAVVAVGSMVQLLLFFAPPPHPPSLCYWPREANVGQQECKENYLFLTCSPLANTLLCPSSPSFPSSSPLGALSCLVPTQGAFREGTETTCLQHFPAVRASSCSGQPAASQTAQVLSWDWG